MGDEVVSGECQERVTGHGSLSLLHTANLYIL